MAIIIDDFNKIDGFVIVKTNSEQYERLDIYKGNAYCVFIQTTSDGSKYLAGFFTDKEHARRCLGLSKGFDRWSMNIREVTIIPRDHGIDWKGLCELLLKAYPGIKITLTNVHRA